MMLIKFVWGLVSVDRPPQTISCLNLVYKTLKQWALTYINPDFDKKEWIAGDFIVTIAFLLVYDMVLLALWFMHSSLLLFYFLFTILVFLYWFSGFWIHCTGFSFSDFFFYIYLVKPGVTDGLGSFILIVYT